MQSGDCTELHLPYAEDLLAVCAQSVVRLCSEQLPDLSAVLVLTPSLHHRQAFLQKLLHEACKLDFQALIPPEVTTLKRLAMRKAAGERKVLEAHERKFILAFLLQGNSGLFKHGDIWQFAEELGLTFDEMLAHGVQKHSNTVFSDTGQERVFLDLFHVWRMHSEGDELPDFHTVYLEYLASDALCHDFEKVFLCGFDKFSRAEADWCEKLLRQGDTTSFLHASLVDVSSASALQKAVPGLTVKSGAKTCSGEVLYQAFDFSRSISERATYCRSRFARSPISPWLNIFWPETISQHVKGLCLRIREWLAEGVNKVTVVSMDRKLSRMLRANLVNQGIKLLDLAGWALSTTSCATVIALLLPREEQGFRCQDIFRLVCSPHCDFKRSPEARARIVSTAREAIASVDYPIHTLNDLLAVLESGTGVSSNRARQSAGLFFRDLSSLLARMDAFFGRRIKSTEFFAEFYSLLEGCGIWNALEDDEAGTEILERLEELRRFGVERTEEANWNFWRSWILHTLEHNSFRPFVKVATGEPHVVLYNMQQATLLQSEALVVAALDHGHMSLSGSILLNEKTRRSLGLPGREDLRVLQQKRFQALLESAPKVLLSCQVYDQGGSVEAVPWLQSLRSFHKACYQDDLSDRALFERSLPSPSTHVDRKNMPRMPAPNAPGRHWSGKISVGAFQVASRCPYRFFVENCLGLKQQKAANNFLGKHDFGHHLHNCFATLHDKMGGLSAKTDPASPAADRQCFLALAREAVENEFSPYTKSSYANHFWWLAANDICERYVDWWLQNQQFCNATEVQSEVELEKEVDDGLCLRGRADLLVFAAPGRVILDYKTGSVPARKRIQQGAEIQLFSYALMSEKVCEVRYLRMQPYGAFRSMVFSGTELAEFQEKTLQRLREFRSDYENSKPLPAWGSDKDCQNCPHGGICRRESWNGQEVPE